MKKLLIIFTLLVFLTSLSDAQLWQAKCGMKQDLIELVRENINPELELQGVVLTMYDKRNKLSDQVAADVRAHLGDKVYNTVIPRNVRISEAPSHGLPALVYDLKCPGSQAYIKLAGELIQRERVRTAA